jgi:hypothetical protein
MFRSEQTIIRPLILSFKFHCVEYIEDPQQVLLYAYTHMQYIMKMYKTQSSHVVFNI